MTGAEPEVYDHTQSDQDRPGRYDGDYLAALTFDGMVDSKYRWKVTVGIWREDRYTARGHREGYEDRDYWAEPVRMRNEFTTKNFKTSEKAVKYLLEVRSAADAVVINRRLSEIRHDQSARIA